MAAIRFYLRFAPTQCQDKRDELARGITTYKTLLDQIRHHRKADEHLCCVTFNYDTLLDQGLRDCGVRLDGLDD